MVMVVLWSLLVDGQVSLECFELLAVQYASSCVCCHRAPSSCPMTGGSFAQFPVFPARTQLRLWCRTRTLQARKHSASRARHRHAPLFGRPTSDVHVACISVPAPVTHGDACTVAHHYSELHTVAFVEVERKVAPETDAWSRC